MAAYIRRTFILYGVAALAGGLLTVLIGAFLAYPRYSAILAVAAAILAALVVVNNAGAEQPERRVGRFRAAHLLRGLALFLLFPRKKR